MSPVLDVAPGTRFGQYRIESVLGRGGMGAVYLAEDTRLERKVAVKLIAADVAQDAAFRDRFLHETRVAASIEHPHIIPVYEAGEMDGVLFLAMRYVSGADLRSVLLRDGRLDPARAVEMLRQVGSALDVAHERGLVHRDVKPENILLARGPQGDHVYLCDFGVAKEQAAETGLTVPGGLVGTLQYMAPEQIGDQSVDRRSDVYALGVLLYECLTGRAPFRGAPVAVMMAHLDRSPPKPSVERPELGTGFDAVVARAMGKRREDRYPSCGVLYEDALAALPPERSPRRPPNAPAPSLSDHYELVADAIVRGRVVPILGAGASQCGREAGGTWTQGQKGVIPRGRELAEYLASEFFYRDDDSDNLLRVAQYVAVKAGPGPLYERLHEVFAVDCPPSPLHRLIARLPAAMRKATRRPRHPVILTTTYDDRLERAFEEEGEAVEVLTYVADGNEQGKFAHRSPGGGETVVIHSPNDYDGLSLEERPAILKIHGTVDRRDPAEDSFVVTEDDYLDYLTHTDISGFVPAPLAVALQRSHFLFLGYRLGEWNFRFTMHRIWGRQSLRYSSWAIQRRVTELDRRFWQQRRVEAIEMDLEQYASGLESVLEQRLAALESC
jgi:Protein kinase domain/SIR2-like domain